MNAFMRSISQRSPPRGGTNVMSGRRSGPDGPLQAKRICQSLPPTASPQRQARPAGRRQVRWRRSSWRARLDDPRDHAAPHRRPGISPRADRASPLPALAQQPRRGPTHHQRIIRLSHRPSSHLCPRVHASPETRSRSKTDRPATYSAIPIDPRHASASSGAHTPRRDARAGATAPLPHDSGRRTRDRVSAARYRPRAPYSRSSPPRSESLHPARQRPRVLRLHHHMHMRPLQADVDDPDPLADRDHDRRLAHRPVHLPPPQTANLRHDAQHDMQRI